MTSLESDSSDAELRAISIRRAAAHEANGKDLRHLKTAISIYGFLWVTEGALRRWVLPDLSDALLIIRDPVVVVIYFLAARARLFRLSNLEWTALCCVGVAFFATFIVGHANLPVALYGARSLLLHLPLIYIMGRSLTIHYAVKLSRVVLFLTLPMSVLLIAQFYSPPTAFINIGVGGVGTSGFSGALDRLRPPGTFSFIIGPAYFYAFATACVFLQLLRGRSSPWLIASACLGILVACPISISRLLLFSVLIVCVVGVAALWSVRKVSSRAIIRLLLPLVIGAVVVLQLSIFRDAVDAFSSRWETSTADEGGVSTSIWSRFLDGLTQPIYTALDQSMFGHGLGMGTNVGAKLLVGQQAFLGGEGEWFRLIFEMGTILGVLFILIRVAIFLELANLARRCWISGNPIPVIFLSVGGLPLVEGQWGQPTSLGFSVFCCGIVAASSHVSVGLTRIRPVSRYIPR